MTRAEIFGVRDLGFSGWVRTALTSERGFTAFDIDFVFRDYVRRRMQIVEVKTRGGNLSVLQKIALPEIAKIFAAGIAAGAPEPGWTWCGFHELKLENTTPKDGQIWWDGELVSEIDLIQLLEMRAI